MFSAMTARPARSSTLRPRTTAPLATPLAVTITWRSMMGVTVTTPGTLRTFSARGSNPVSEFVVP